MIVIIEPYWNWNHRAKLLTIGSVKVIIEPYWNWNILVDFFRNIETVIIEPYWNWNISSITCFIGVN